jgi:hypothetical protein
VKDGKAWNDVVLKTSNPCKLVVLEEEEKKKRSLWLNYALSYLLNTFKHNMVY